MVAQPCQPVPSPKNDTVSKRPPTNGKDMYRYIAYDSLQQPIPYKRHTHSTARSSPIGGAERLQCCCLECGYVQMYCTEVLGGCILAAAMRRFVRYIILFCAGGCG